MRRNECLRPKTVPHSPDNQGITRNPPDAPIPARIELSKLAVALDPRMPGVRSDGSATIGTVFRVDEHEGVHKQTARIPIIKGPLTLVFHTAVGGGRVGGGGTSKEALQRAKKQAKRRRNARLNLKRKRG